MIKPDVEVLAANLRTQIGYFNTRHKEIEEFSRRIKELDYLMTMVSALETTPIIHAYWIKNKQGGADYTCSHCRETEAKTSRYCPNCGAKMDVRIK